MLTPSFFEVWARMGHSDLLQFGICLFLILLCAFHCPPRNNHVSCPLLHLQILAWYLLNHYLFWHISNFSWKTENRVFCILQRHIHLERRKEDDICVRVRNHSDLNPCTPVINTLWTRKHLIDVVAVFQLSRHPVAQVHSHWLCLSGHIIAVIVQDVEKVAEHSLHGQFSGYCCSSARMQFSKVMPSLRKAWENLSHSFDKINSVTG